MILTIRSTRLQVPLLLGMILTTALVMISNHSMARATTATTPIRLHGLNYNTRKGPDWDWDKCKTRAEILTELTLMKRLTNKIRILSLGDCGQAVLVSSVARELGMQLWLGLWMGVSPGVFENEKHHLQHLIRDGYFDDDTILGVTVGSEAIYRDDVTVEEAIQGMYAVSALLKSSGIYVPVSIVDIAPVYSAEPLLRQAVDITMANTFPFWEGIPIEGAIADLEEDIDWLLGLPESRGKGFVLTETGWPSDGFIKGTGVASPETQVKYFVDFYCRIHVEKQWDYFYFTGVDNAWRQEQDPNNSIEGNWGFYYSDLTLKEHFRDLEFTCSDGVTYSFQGLDQSAPAFTNAPTPLDPASCQADNGCAGLGLWGNCCPNYNGEYLGCCNNARNPESTTMQTPDPTGRPVTKPPTTSEPTQRLVTNLPTKSPPTDPPTGDPTNAPTAIPTSTPTHVPTIWPRRHHTVSPTTRTPSELPTDTPTTLEPTTDTPTLAPTTDAPTSIPTPVPSQSEQETNEPTRIPTASSTIDTPTVAPTDDPTLMPTDTPTGSAKTDAPSFHPATNSPSRPPMEYPKITTPNVSTNADKIPVDMLTELGDEPEEEEITTDSVDFLMTSSVADLQCRKTPILLALVVGVFLL